MCQVDRCFTCQQVLHDEAVAFVCEECKETYCKTCWDKDLALEQFEGLSSPICGTCYSYIGNDDGDDFNGCIDFDDDVEFDD